MRLRLRCIFYSSSCNTLSSLSPPYYKGQVDKIKGEGGGRGGRWVRLGWGGGMGKRGIQLSLNNNKNFFKCIFWFSLLLLDVLFYRNLNFRLIIIIQG